MPHFYALVAGLLDACSARARYTLHLGTSPTNIQVADSTATTVTFNGGAGSIFFGPGCSTRLSYTYAGGSPVSAPDARPLLPTHLPSGTANTLAVGRHFRGPRGGAGTVP